MIDGPLSHQLVAKVENSTDFDDEEKVVLRQVIVDYQRLATAGIFVKWFSNIVIKAAAVLAASYFIYTTWQGKS